MAQNEAQKLSTDLGITHTVDLNYPLTLPTGQKLTSITLRRARVGDLRAVAHLTNEAEQGLALMSRVTGLVPEDLDMLDLADFNRLQDVFRQQQEAEAV